MVLAGAARADVAGRMTGVSAILPAKIVNLIINEKLLRVFH
jgi:hypothetical protein